MKERKTIGKFFIIVAMGVGVIFYWFTPVQFMQAVNADNIAYLTIASGVNGEEHIIEDIDNIGFVIDNIKSKSMRRTKLSSTYIGVGVKISFWDKQGSVIDTFFINDSTTIRKDPFFYKVTSGTLCYDYLIGLIENS